MTTKSALASKDSQPKQLTVKFAECVDVDAPNTDDDSTESLPESAEREVCQLCKNTFLTAARRDTHLWKSHALAVANFERHLCPYCTETFPRGWLMRQHVAQKHREGAVEHGRTFADMVAIAKKFPVGHGCTEVDVKQRLTTEIALAPKARASPADNRGATTKALVRSVLGIVETPKVAHAVSAADASNSRSQEKSKLVSDARDIKKQYNDKKRALEETASKFDEEYASKRRALDTEIKALDAQYTDTQRELATKIGTLDLIDLLALDDKK